MISSNNNVVVIIMVNNNNCISRNEVVAVDYDVVMLLLLLLMKQVHPQLYIRAAFIAPQSLPLLLCANLPTDRRSIRPSIWAACRARVT